MLFLWFVLAFFFVFFFLYFFVLKCLDCLFGLSLFFVVVLCHQGGEDTCRKPTEAHVRNLLRVPPAGFWSRGGGQEPGPNLGALWGSLGAPGVAELSPAPRGRCHTPCATTVVFAAAAPGLIPALPTETKRKFHHRTLLNQAGSRPRLEAKTW